MLWVLVLVLILVFLGCDGWMLMVGYVISLVVVVGMFWVTFNLIKICKK